MLLLTTHHRDHSLAYHSTSFATVSPRDPLHQKVAMEAEDGYCQYALTTSSNFMKSMNFGNHLESSAGNTGTGAENTDFIFSKRKQCESMMRTPSEQSSLTRIDASQSDHVNDQVNVSVRLSSDLIGRVVLVHSASPGHPTMVLNFTCHGRSDQSWLGESYWRKLDCT